VTDANLLTGHLDSGAELPGLGRLDTDAARTAFDRAGVTPDGVLEVVDANMEQALRSVSVERGIDPRDLALVAFGGAGPLHACALADALGMTTVIVPPRAGVLSAVGLLCSPEQRDLVRSWPRPDDLTGLDEARADLADQVAALLGSSSGPVEVHTSVDCRYAGQSHELQVDEVGHFHDEHRRRNGYADVDAPIEVVALRATARREAPLAVTDLPVVERTGGDGPIVIAEADCTVWVPEGWSAEPGPTGALIIRPVGR
jgi:N-methylhydantoinase A/oxoprolinase/acetone carboxylase beta subunit